MASASAAASSRERLSRKKVMRWAERRPMPGSLESSVISCSTGAGNIIQGLYTDLHPVRLTSAPGYSARR